jgi:hypothetical protein
VCTYTPASPGDAGQRRALGRRPVRRGPHHRDPGAALGRRRAGGPTRAPDGRPHRLPDRRAAGPGARADGGPAPRRRKDPGVVGSDMFTTRAARPTDRAPPALRSGCAGQVPVRSARERCDDVRSTGGAADRTGCSPVTLRQTGTRHHAMSGTSCRSATRRTRIPTARDAFPLEPQDADELAAELKYLREEVDLLRRRLEGAPARIRLLEERLLETNGQLQAAQAQNAKLSETLRTRPRAARRAQVRARAPVGAAPRLRDLPRPRRGSRHGRRHGVGTQDAGHARPRDRAPRRSTAARRSCSTTP